MKKRLFCLLCLISLSTKVIGQESCNASCTRYCCRGQSSVYGSSYSVGSSMMTWGVLFFVGIALLTFFISPSHDHDASNDNPNDDT